MRGRLAACVFTVHMCSFIYYLEHSLLIYSFINPTGCPTPMCGNYCDTYKSDKNGCMSCKCDDQGSTPHPVSIQKRGRFLSPGVFR